MVNLKDIITSCILFMQLLIVVSITEQNTRIKNELHWDTVKLQLREVSTKFRNICNTNEDNIRTVSTEKLEICIRPEFDSLMNIYDSIKLGEKSNISNAINNIKIGKHLEPKEMNMIKNIIAPICKSVPVLIKCITSELIESIKHCAPATSVNLIIKSIEYNEVVIKSICKNGGERIIDFFSNGGAYCMESYGNRGMECLLNKSEIFQREETEEDTILEMCNSIEIIHNNCFSQSLNYCEKKKPSEILHSILDDVKPWISKSCLISSANSVQYLASLIFIPIIFVLTRVIHHEV